MQENQVGLKIEKPIDFHEGVKETWTCEGCGNKWGVLRAGGGKWTDPQVIAGHKCPQCLSFQERSRN